MKSIEEILESRRVKIIDQSEDGFSGIYTVYNFQASIICSWGAGWEHVSIAPFKRRYIPTWEDMCYLKDIFFKDDEAVIQIHPAKKDYVNLKENCLHLWRCRYKDMVLPPNILVGITRGMTQDEIRNEIKEAYRIAGESVEI